MIVPLTQDTKALSYIYKLNDDVSIDKADINMNKVNYHIMHTTVDELLRAKEVFTLTLVANTKLLVTKNYKNKIKDMPIYECIHTYV